MERKKMKYTPEHFKACLPPLHNRKSSFLVKCIYRPLSFQCSALAANLGISANAVSYFSSLVAFASCAMFIVDSYAAHIAGAVLANVWLLLDCVDGNLARGVKKQAFGEYADALSGYFLAGFLCTAMGYAAYKEGGILIQAGAGWLILCGALASSSDSLMRLQYHKYKEVEQDLADRGRIQIDDDVFKNLDHGDDIKVRIEFELGICGILPLFSLLAAIFHALDIVVLYCFLYYCLSFIGCILLYVIRAVKKAKSLGDIS